MRSPLTPLSQREALEILDRDPGAYLEHHKRINANPGQPFSHLVTTSPRACWRIDWRCMAPLRRSGAIVQDRVGAHVWRYTGRTERRRRYYVQTPRGTVPDSRTIKNARPTVSDSVRMVVRYQTAERIAERLIERGERYVEIMREGEINPVRVLTLGTNP